MPVQYSNGVTACQKLRALPSEFCNADSPRKTVMIHYALARRKCLMTCFNRFGTIPECNRQIDGRKGITTAPQTPKCGGGGRRVKGFTAGKKKL